MGPEDVRRARYLADLCSAMKSVRKPMIAAVEGMAVSHPSSQVCVQIVFEPRYQNGLELHREASTDLHRVTLFADNRAVGACKN